MGFFFLVVADFINFEIVNWCSLHTQDISFPMGHIRLSSIFQYI